MQATLNGATKVKALSLCQPYADLVVSGWKTIELRSWDTRFRGVFLIHAAKAVRKADVKRLNATGFGPGGEFVTGALIGKAELRDTRAYESAEDVDNDAESHFAPTGINAKYGFMLRKAVRFQTPIPCVGRLGFFNVEYDPDTAIFAEDDC